MIYAKDTEGQLRIFEPGSKEDSLHFISNQVAAREFIYQETGVKVRGAVMWLVK